MRVPVGRRNVDRRRNIERRRDAPANFASSRRDLDIFGWRTERAAGGPPMCAIETRLNARISTTRDLSSVIPFLFVINIFVPSALPPPPSSSCSSRATHINHRCDTFIIERAMYYDGLSRRNEGRITSARAMELRVSGRSADRLSARPRLEKCDFHVVVIKHRRAERCSPLIGARYEWRLGRRRS